MTREELHALPPAVDLPTAAEVLGVGRGLAYELVRRNEWPTPVLRIGRFIKIPTAPLISLLEAGAVASAGGAAAGLPLTEVAS